MAWEEDSNLWKTREIQRRGGTNRDFSDMRFTFWNDGTQIFASSLEERLFCSLRLLLGEERGKLRARAGVGELGGRLGGAAAVLHVQILHEQHLMKAKAWSNQETRRGK